MFICLKINKNFLKFQYKFFFSLTTINTYHAILIKFFSVLSPVPFSDTFPEPYREQSINSEVEMGENESGEEELSEEDESDQQTLIFRGPEHSRVVEPSELIGLGSYLGLGRSAKIYICIAPSSKSHLNWQTFNVTL